MHDEAISYTGSCIDTNSSDFFSRSLSTFSEANSSSAAASDFFQESRIDELACLLDRVNRMEFSFEIGINSLNYLK